MTPGGAPREHGASAAGRADLDPDLAFDSSGGGASAGARGAGVADPGGALERSPSPRWHYRMADPELGSSGRGSSRRCWKTARARPRHPPGRRVARSAGGATREVPTRALAGARGFGWAGDDAPTRPLRRAAGSLVRSRSTWAARAARRTGSGRGAERRFWRSSSRGCAQRGCRGARPSEQT